MLASGSAYAASRKDEIGKHARKAGDATIITAINGKKWIERKIKEANKDST